MSLRTAVHNNFFSRRAFRKDDAGLALPELNHQNLSRSGRLEPDSIFDTQKAFESRRQAACKFLPRENLASGPEIGGQDAPDNSIPLFKQVRPARIEQDAELQVQRMCSKYISQQLI